MLRYTTALFLLAAIAAQTFYQAVVVLDYYTNTASFALRCENKARPAMHCNGKCQMMKKLKEEEKKEKQNPGRRTDNREQTLSSKSFFATLHFYLSPSLPNPSATLQPGRPIDRAYPVFHPPALV